MRREGGSPRGTVPHLGPGGNTIIKRVIATLAVVGLSCGIGFTAAASAGSGDNGQRVTWTNTIGSPAAGSVKTTTLTRERTGEFVKLCRTIATTQFTNGTATSGQSSLSCTDPVNMSTDAGVNQLLTIERFFIDQSYNP